MSTESSVTIRFPVAEEQQTEAAVLYAVYRVMSDPVLVGMPKVLRDALPADYVIEAGPERIPEDPVT